MKRSISNYAFTLAFILAFTAANARLVKRDGEDSGGDDSDGDSSGGGIVAIITSVSDMGRSVPLVGDYIGYGFDTATGAYQGAQDVTDGAVGRLLGGAFPCEVSLELGIVCTGNTVNSKLGDLVKALIDPLPSLIFPEFAKGLIIFLINMFVEPALDVIFGGVPLPNASAP